MSYNITHTITLKVENAWIAETDRVALLRDFGAGLPEVCSLREARPRWLHGGRYDLAPADEHGRRYILDWRWGGTGSGASYNSVLPVVASKIHGTIELVVIWEGGESIRGLRIVDGAMTEPLVSYVLDAE